MSEIEKIGSATFSTCLKFRYTLDRKLLDNNNNILFLLLNPSKADEYINDNTIAKCMKYAKSWDYGNFRVCNIFAYRSTDPRGLKQTHALGVDPIGSNNDQSIQESCSQADMVVCGWGQHGKLLERGKHITNMLANICQNKLYYLKLCNNGAPSHPLYLTNTLSPSKWELKDINRYVDSFEYSK